MNPSGEWARIGPHEVLVPESSATAIAGLQRSDSFAINEDHSNMVKFSPNETAYRSVLAAISQAVKEFLNTTQQESSTSYLAVAAQKTLEASPTDRLHGRTTNIIGSLDFTKFTPAKWLDHYRQTSVEFCESLDFKEIGLREDDIVDAQDDTFSWIMQDESLGFTKWLRSNSGLYWSTLR